MNGPNIFLPYGSYVKDMPSFFWPYVISDSLIILSCCSISVGIAYFVWKRKDLQFSWIFILFGAFVLAFGITHLLGILVMWIPIYWIDASLKAVTAILSIITAIALFFLLPKVSKPPPPIQPNEELRNHPDAHEALKLAQVSLKEENESHEQRANALAAELNKQRHICAMLYSMNQAIARLNDYETLFREICRIIVDIGKFKYVWVGKVNLENKETLPIYSYGNDAGYVGKLNPGFYEAMRDPVVLACLSENPYIEKDFTSGSKTEPWSEFTKLAEILGSGVFPVVVDGEVVYTINIDTDKEGSLEKVLIPTLLEMSRNVSFALKDYKEEQEHQQQAQALRDLNRDFISFLEVASDFIYFKDADSRFRFCSRALAEMTGHSDWHDLIGKNDFEVFPEEMAKIYQAEEAVVFNKGESIRNKVDPFQGVSGYNGWLETNKWPLFDDAGKVVGLFGISRDVTEHKHLEEELKASAEQFKALVEQAIAGMYIIQENVLAYCNEHFAKIFGYESAKELIGRSPMIHVQEQDVALVAGNIRLRLTGEKLNMNYTFHGLRKDGTKIMVSVHGSRATYLGKPAVIGLIQDISEKSRDEEKIARYITQLQDAFMNTVRIATTLSEMRDPYTAGHERRVAELSVAISAELGFDENRQQGIRVAGYLHDIGKITIPAEILSKPGKLNEIENVMIKEHVQSGYDVLKDIEFPWPVAQVVLQHHEHIDGSGYPQALKGEEIILEARILAVADTVEAMSNHRPYRPALGIENALIEIEHRRGSFYDEKVVDACIRLFKEKNYVIPD